VAAAGARDRAIREAEEAARKQREREPARV
jgi:hypothetical protein